MSKPRPDVVLISGCSQGGIGYALAREFRQHGCHVFATARRVEVMEGLRQLGVSTLPMDVTSKESIEVAVAKVVEDAGRVDILVNNAGIGYAGPIAEASLADVRRVFETNVFGAVAVTQAVFPHMATKRFGKIINVGSVAGYIARPWGFSYSSSKAALAAVTNCMRLEMKPFGIQVMLLAPGLVRTNIFSSTAQASPPLSSTSFYRPYLATMRSNFGKDSDKPGVITAEVFAQRVVTVSLKARLPWRFITGYQSGPAMWVSWLPMWLQDKILWQVFGGKPDPVQESSASQAPMGKLARS